MLIKKYTNICSKITNMFKIKHIKLILITCFIIIQSAVYSNTLLPNVDPESDSATKNHVYYLELLIHL